jgi:hypothetical protein
MEAVSDPLAEFNRQDWADTPYTIELHGGHADGQRFNVQTLPRAWQMPDHPPLTLIPAKDEPAVLPTVMYRPTGEVTDEGHHIYQAG